VRATTLNGAVNGAVIVHHCNSWQTAAVLGSILWQLREWGIGVGVHQVFVGNFMLPRPYAMRADSGR
jgi:hypothetical protein